MQKSLSETTWRQLHCSRNESWLNSPDIKQRGFGVSVPQVESMQRPAVIQHIN